MNNRFISYLETIHTSKTNYLAASHNTVDLACNDGSAGRITRILNNYPMQVGGNFPFDPSVIKLCSKYWHNALMEMNAKYWHAADGESVKDQQIIKNNNDITMRHMKPVLDKMFAMAREYILDENGDFYPSIANILNLKPLLEKFDPEIVKKQIMIAYITQLLISATETAWLLNQEFQEQLFAEKFNHKNLLGSIRKILQEHLDEKDFLKKNLLEQINTALTKRPASADGVLTWIGKGVGNAFGKAVGFIESEEKVTDRLATELAVNILDLIDCLEIDTKQILNKQDFLNRVSEKFKELYKAQTANPLWKQLGLEDNMFAVEIVMLIESVAKEHLENEIKLSAGLGGGVITRITNALLDNGYGQLILAKISDYNVYGKALADNFDETYFVDFCKKTADYAYHITEIQFWETYTSQLNECLFPESLLQTVTFQFNHLLTSTESIDKFVIRIMLFAYAAILDETGAVKPAIIASLNAAVVQEENLKEKLLAGFISDLLARALSAWFNSAEYKKSFYENTHLSATIVDETIKNILTKLNTKLSIETLQTIKGFPFIAVPRASEATFSIQLNIPTDIIMDRFLNRLKNDAAIQHKKTILLLDGYVSKYKTTTSTYKSLYDNLNTSLAKFIAAQDIYVASDSTGHARNISTLSNTLDTNYHTLTTTLKNMEDKLRTLKNERHLYTHSEVPRIEMDNEIINQAIQAFSASHQQIAEYIAPKLAARDAALPRLTTILERLEFILLENSRFWLRRVGIVGGVAQYFEDNAGAIPTRVSAMIEVLRDPTDERLKTPADIRLYKMLSMYAKKTQATNENIFGLFSYWSRSKKTIAFYDVIDGLIETLQKNFYDNTALDHYFGELDQFMLKYNDNYQLHNNFQLAEQAKAATLRS